MTDINTKIIQAASGEQRLKPDEQGQFLGTFKERVVLTIAKEDALTDLINSQLTAILSHYQEIYINLTLKINGELPSSKQLLLFEKAQQLHLDSMIVNDTNSHSPFALVLHTDKAENKTITDIKALFPEQWQTIPLDTPQEKKKGFWQQLFGK